MAKKAKKKGKGADDDDLDLNLEEGDDKAAGRKGGKGKLIAIIAVAALVILGGAGGGLFYFGLLDSLLGTEHAAETATAEPEADPHDLGVPVYYDIPEFVADLKTGDCRSPLVKLSLTIQVDQADQAVLAERQAKIIDRILRHLRDQERQVLMGQEGAETLRSDIILIVNATIKPAMVQNVLFRSMVLQ